MNGLVAAPLQFCADRRFAGAGNALDEIISFAHQTINYFAGGITALAWRLNCQITADHASLRLRGGSNTERQSTG
jgi:hypothetical protein